MSQVKGVAIRYIESSLINYGIKHRLWSPYVEILYRINSNYLEHYIE